MTNFTISLLGCCLNSGNMGVSALAASLTKLFSSIGEHVQINLLIGNKDSEPQIALVGNRQLSLTVVNHRLSPRANFQEHILGILIMAILYRMLPLKSIKKRILDKNNWIRTVIQSDIIGDIQGGDSFSDIYGIKLFTLHSLPLFIIRLLGKNFVLLPQTYGPYRSPLARLMARYLILNATKVFTRDKEGFTYLNALLKKKYQTVAPVFCPDVAFVLDPQAIVAPQIEPPLPKSPKILIGLNINGLMYNGGYTQKNMFSLALDYRLFINELIKSLLTTNSDAHLLLIPHTFGDDNNVNSDPNACKKTLEEIQKTASHLLPRIHLLKSEHNAHQLKNLISSCQYFIGSRMHSCIAALSQGVPTISVAYSYKFIGVFNSIGLGHAVIDARDCDIPSALKKIEILMQGKTEEQANQKSNVEQAKKQIYAVFESLINETRLKKNNPLLPL